LFDFGGITPYKELIRPRERGGWQRGGPSSSLPKNKLLGPNENQNDL